MWYAKYILTKPGDKHGPGVLRYRVPDILYYEITHDGYVTRRINVRSYEKTIELLELHKLNQMDGYERPSLVERKFIDEEEFLQLHPNDSGKGNFPITKEEFEEIWIGQSEIYPSYSLTKIWEKDG